MKRTISQLVYDLLDKEGILPATEIAKRMGIIRGTACSARDRWKKTRESQNLGTPEGRILNREEKLACVIALEKDKSLGAWGKSALKKLLKHIGLKARSPR